MPENRYDDILRIGNRAILRLSPSNVVIREELAREIHKFVGHGILEDVLELGIGEGDLTKPILEYSPGLILTAVDISSEMIIAAKKYLGQDAYRVKFVCEDALEYMMKIPVPSYGLSAFSFFVHNFKKEDQKKLFEQIHRGLFPCGQMIIAEKIYPDEPEAALHLFNLQMARYRNYLDTELADAIIEHEIQDFSMDYRMSEKETITLLKGIGFKSVLIKDRVESVALLLAEK